MQQTEPVEEAPKTTRARKTATQALPRDNSRDVAPAEVMARDLCAEDIDETEDFGLIEATRALAHIVDPCDLVAFRDYLAPSDYLPPEERRSDWLKRVHRGESDGASA